MILRSDSRFVSRFAKVVNCTPLATRVPLSSPTQNAQRRTPLVRIVSPSSVIGSTIHGGVCSLIVNETVAEADLPASVVIVTTHSWGPSARFLMENAAVAPVRSSSATTEAPPSSSYVTS